MLIVKTGKGSFYIALQSVGPLKALHTLSPLADLFIPTPLGFSEKHSSDAAITHEN